jgi:site-specific DNA-cytosine methylase
MTSELKTSQTINCLWEDFLVRLFQLLEKDLELKNIVDSYSTRLPELQKLKDLRFYSLKMLEDSSHQEMEKILPLSFKGWGSWGIFYSGHVLTAGTLESRRIGKECSLSDILEKNVSEEYFLSLKEQERLLQRLDDGEKANTEVSYAIDANYHKGGGTENFLDRHKRQLVIEEDEEEIEVNKFIDNGEPQQVFDYHFNRCESPKSGVSPTILTTVEEHTYVLVKQDELKKQKEITQTPMRLVRTEEAKKVRAEAMKNGKDDTPFGEGYRELVESKEDIAGCILGNANPDTLIKVEDNRALFNQVDRITPIDGVAPAVITPSGGGHIPKIAQALQTDGALREGYSFGTTKPQSARNIRVLTPLECERLQGFPDFWTKVNGVSRTQRYQCLGNAVTVNVIEYLGRRLLSFDQRVKKKLFEDCF